MASLSLTEQQPLPGLASKRLDKQGLDYTGRRLCDNAIDFYTLIKHHKG